MITVVEPRRRDERALVARLVPRCRSTTVRARLFFPEGRALGPDVPGLLAGPPEGVAYLAMDEHRPVGLANMVPLADGTVETALLVADRWQRRGIGRLLLDHALADPRWRDHAVVATVQPSNRAVMRLLRSTGLPLRLTDTAPGECYFELRPAMRPVSAPVPG